MSTAWISGKAKRNVTHGSLQGPRIIDKHHKKNWIYLKINNN